MYDPPSLHNQTWRRLLGAPTDLCYRASRIRDGRGQDWLIVWMQNQPRRFRNLENFWSNVHGNAESSETLTSTGDQTQPGPNKAAPAPVKQSSFHPHLCTRVPTLLLHHPVIFTQLAASISATAATSERLPSDPTSAPLASSSTVTPSNAASLRLLRRLCAVAARRPCSAPSRAWF